VGKGTAKVGKCKGKIGFLPNLPLFGKLLWKTLQKQGNIPQKPG
jgi:hypothetical protein